MTSLPLLSVAETFLSPPTIEGYDIRELGARDASSVVYRALHSATQSVRNLRCFVRRPDADQEQWQTALRQLRGLLQQLPQIEAHPGVEKVVDFGETHSLFYIATDVLEGRTLESLLRVEGAKSLEWSLPLITQIASTLDYIASRHLPHTDLHPGNIFLTDSDDRVLLLNFVPARVCRWNASPYQPPEQVKGLNADARSDLYSLGAVFYACLAGRPPYAVEERETLGQRIITTRPPVLQSQPAYVRNVLARLMAASPRDRYRVAVDMIDDLRHKRSPEVVLDDTPEADPTAQIQFDNLLVQNDPLDYAVAAAEPSMADPYGRSTSKKGDGSLGNLFRVALDLPLHLLDAIGAALPFRRRTAETTPHTPRRLSAFELRLYYLLGRIWTYSFRFSLATVLLLSVHAVYIATQQRYVVVTDLTGHPMRINGSQKTPLQPGEKLDAESLPIITTDKNSTVTLQSADSQVKLEPNGSLQIRRLDIDEGRIRVFALRSGQMFAHVGKLRGTNSRFEVTCNEVRVRVHGTRFQVAATEDGAKVKVGEGIVSVVGGAGRRQVRPTAQVEASADDGVSQPSPMSGKEQATLQTETGGASADTIPSRLLHDYNALQEDRLVPLANRLLVLLHLKPASKSMAQNAGATSSAKVALTGIGKALSMEGDPPKTLDLRTLEELGLDEKQAKPLLENFESHRLLAFYHLKDDGYLLFARANDSNHTLFRDLNGKVSGIKEEDEEKVLADARASQEH